MLATLAAVAVSSGCASQRPFLNVASKSKPVRLAVVQKALTKTLRSSGQFEETLNLTAGSVDVLTQQKSGSFDSSGKRIAMTVRFESSDPTMDVGAAVVQLRMFGDDLYMHMPAWRDARRGKWLKYTRKSLSSLAAQQGLDISPTAAGRFVPSNLLGAIDDARDGVTAARTRDGFVTYQLTLAASDAVYALGNSVVKTLVSSGHDVSDLTGTVTVTVEQTPGGTIDLVKMDGTHMLRQASRLAGAPAQDVNKIDAFSTLRIFGLGRPFTATVPQGTQIYRK